MEKDDSVFLSGWCYSAFYSLSFQRLHGYADGSADAPTLSAKGYVLMDYNTGKVLVRKRC